MSARRRRTPLGTQPPAVRARTSEEQDAVAGTIETEKVDPKDLEAKAEPDQEHAVIVQIDDDWLERLELPSD